MKLKYFVFDKDDNEVEKIVSKREAISLMKAKKKFLNSNFKYENDEDALKEFIETHFASIVDDGKTE